MTPPRRMLLSRNNRFNPNKAASESAMSQTDVADVVAGVARHDEPADEGMPSLVTAEEDEDYRPEASGVPAAIVPGGGYWTGGSSTQSGAEREFRASLDARAQAAIDSLNDLAREHMNQTPEPTLPPDEVYFMWWIKREGVRAYTECDLERRVFLEVIGHKDQMICGSWHNEQGFISLGTR